MQQQATKTKPKQAETKHPHPILTSLQDPILFGKPSFPCRDSLSHPRKPPPPPYSALRLPEPDSTATTLTPSVHPTSAPTREPPPHSIPPWEFSSQAGHLSGDQPYPAVRAL
ncbi:unnamed protein product [Diplocarpon coronariae]